MLAFTDFSYALNTRRDWKEKKRLHVLYTVEKCSHWGLLVGDCSNFGRSWTLLHKNALIIEMKPHLETGELNWTDAMSVAVSLFVRFVVFLSLFSLVPTL